MSNEIDISSGGFDYPKKIPFDLKNDMMVDTESIESDSSIITRSSGPSVSLSLPDSFDNSRIGSDDEEDYGPNSLQKVLSIMKSTYAGKDIMNKLLEGNCDRETSSKFDGKYSGHIDSDLYLRKEIERMQKLLTHEKDLFKDLYISRATYDELIIRPEDELSLKEFVCLRVEELVYVHRMTGEKNALELEKAMHALDGANGTVHMQAAEISRLNTQVRLMSESHGREMLTMTEQRRRLEDQLHRLSEDNNRMFEAASKLESLSAEAEECREEVKGLRVALRDQAQAVLQTQESETQLRQQVADLQRQLDMRRLDLDYLHSQLRDSRRQADERSRAAEAGEAKALVLESKVSELSERLVSIQLSSSSDTQFRLDKELERIKSEMRAEAQVALEAQREISDREMRGLKELRMALEQDLENTRRRADRLAEDLLRVTAESTLKIVDRDREVSDLRAEVKLRSFEITAVRATLEERSACVREQELELQFLRDQQAAYKTAFSRLESEYEEEKHALQRALETTEAKLRLLEQTGPVAAPADREDGSPSEFVKLRQTLQLSKILESKARTEIESLRAQVSCDDKDTVVSYMSSRMRDMEAEAAEAASQIIDLESRLLTAESERDARLQEVNQLRERLQCVLCQRAEVSALRHLLEEYMEEAGTGEIESDRTSDPSDREKTPVTTTSRIPSVYDLSPAQIQQLTVHRGSPSSGWHRREMLTQRRPGSSGHA